MAGKGCFPLINRKFSNLKQLALLIAPYPIDLLAEFYLQKGRKHRPAIVNGINP
jgi:hypothetical protein